MTNSLSIFDIFKIGIGPSSSHTVGPMVSANNFVSYISKNILSIKSIKVELFGSLSHTGFGHKIVDAIILGLSGEKPSTVKIEDIKTIISNNKDSNQINLNKIKTIKFKSSESIIFNKEKVFDFHSNTITFEATLQNADKIKKTYYSIGGGFVVEDGVEEKPTNINHKFFFNTSAELLEICKSNDINIYDVVLENEFMNLSKTDVKNKILHISKTMDECIENGIHKTGKIDSILGLNRKANTLYKSLKAKEVYDPLELMDWVNIFAISVCEENASGSKIVTAPTNGAAGIIPAVLKYYKKFTNSSNDEGVIKFLATSSAIGMLFKINSSISGAEVGCQGEVGVACSMAAAGLTAALGGTPKQIENAAEIGMEHNLGLTCDPVKGLVQIPCIERNSMGAIKAINASRLSLNTDDTHKVTLDQVIKTMNETGKSMSKIYKETSLGGLAVNVVEC